MTGSDDNIVPFRRRPRSADATSPKKRRKGRPLARPERTDIIAAISTLQAFFFDSLIEWRGRLAAQPRDEALRLDFLSEVELEELQFLCGLMSKKAELELVDRRNKT
jgi:hypothetical protein